MLTRAQEKFISELKTKKGRDASGRCLVEGRKVIETAGDSVELIFSRNDTKNFDRLVDVETPQDIAAIAKIPQWDERAVFERDTVVVLDGVQDPGNVGSIIRLCLGFNASLILIESADVSSPKVVRSSVGAVFQVPWIKYVRKDVVARISKQKHAIYRLEKKDDIKAVSIPQDIKKLAKKAIIIAGSEGGGIKLEVEGISTTIQHDKALESLNVGHALAIILSLRYKK